MIKYPMIEAYAQLSGLTLDSLASKLGITKRTLSNKIKGRTDFTLSESRELARILSLPVEQIFFTRNVS